MSNIVTNGSFETGSLSPWVQALPDPDNFIEVAATGTTANGMTACGYMFTTSAESGTYALYMGNNGYLNNITQTLTTIPNGVYQLTYWLYQEQCVTSSSPHPPKSSGPIVFDAYWNGTLIPLSTIDNANPLQPFNTYVEFTFNNLIATSTQTVLEFDFRNDPSYFQLDNISVVQTSGPCYHGDSKILTKNTATGEIKTIKATEVLSGIHQVFSTSSQKFTPVVYNIVTGPNTKFYLIKRNSIADKQPSSDLYITAGHPVVINGTEMEARLIPKSIKTKLDPTLVYSICTDKREPILVNGLNVMTWEANEWTKLSTEKKIVWHDNGKPETVYNL